MKSVRQRKIPYDIIYMWNLKYNTNKPIYKIETDSDMDNRPMVVSGERQWERDGLGVWD